jgi:maltose alpha-D-glucosyltransferase/alpha-amylase
MPSPLTNFQPLALPSGAGFEWLCAPEGRRWLCDTVLPSWLPTRRWFSEKAHAIARCSIEDSVTAADQTHVLLLVRVDFEDGASRRYAVPLSLGPESEVDSPSISVLAGNSSRLTLRDAVFDSAFRQSLLELIRAGATQTAPETRVTLHPVCGGGLVGLGEPALDRSRVLGVEQSNTSILYGQHLFMKVFRRIESGLSPDIEVTRYLSEVRAFGHVPPFAGSIEFRFADGGLAPFALLLGWVENSGDAWAWALEEVRGARESGGFRAGTAMRLNQLGRRTAELHHALCDFDAPPAFRPEPLTGTDFTRLANDVGARFDATLASLISGHGNDPLVQQLRARSREIRERIHALASLPPGSLKTRHHGDYHLGQVLDTGSDWMIIDFEGEPLRPLAERRAKHSPLRDVSGMLRSLHYAAHAPDPGADPDFSARWYRSASEAYLSGYRAAASDAPFLPNDESSFQRLLAGFLLEKALYETGYEMNNRPAWIRIPLAGLLAILEESPPQAYFG